MALSRTQLIDDCVTWTAGVHGILPVEVDRKQFEDMDDDTLLLEWDWLYDLFYLK